MMGQSIWLIFPSLIALNINAWILIKSNKRHLLKANFYLAVFFVSIMGLNLIEFLTLSSMVPPNLLFMKAYYVLMALALTSVLLLSITLSGINALQERIRTIRQTIYGIAALSSILILCTDWIIKGFETTSFTVTRVPGDYYIFMQVFFFVVLLASISYLSIGATKPSCSSTQKRCRIILLSFSPLIISLMSVVILMQLNFKINATFILPITTTFLMLALINTECKEDLFKLLLKLPYTSERKSYREIITEIENFLTNTSKGEKSSLKSLTNSLEQHIVSMAVDLSNGSQIQAATLLNTSASSICRKKKVVANNSRSALA